MLETAEENFNTSHVNVNQRSLNDNAIYPQNFNTSHVNVNQKGILFRQLYK